MHESEREIRARIEESRSRMGETVEEIGARVNPDRVQRELKARARGEVDELKATMKQKARSTMRNLEHEAEESGRGVWRTIKENPVPATMVGVGLAWLMANGGGTSDEAEHRQGRPMTYGSDAPFPPVYPRAHEYGYETRARAEPRRAMATEAELRMEAESEGDVSRAKERATEVAEEAREKASELSDRSRDQVREARHRASQWSDRVEHRAMRAERRVEHAVQDNPLAAGAMAAALGFAAGLMVPETQREHELMGESRDRLLDQAQDTARTSAEKARQSARETAGEAAGNAARRAVDEAFPEGPGEEDRAMTEPGRG